MGNCCKKRKKKYKNHKLEFYDISSSEIEINDYQNSSFDSLYNQEKSKNVKLKKFKNVNNVDSFEESKYSFEGIQNNFKNLNNKNNKKRKDYQVIEVKPNKEDKKETILIGLNNIGATCYMNATLQCLSNTDKLTNYFLNKYKPNNNKIISNEYYEVIKNLWNRNNNHGSYSPNDFKIKLSEENPLFAGIAANDSKDLITFLIERFHKELNTINNNNEINYNPIDQLDEQKMLNLFSKEFEMNYNSIISQLFYGLLETKAQCQKCKNIKYNFQIYSFIEFPLEKINQYCFNTGKRNYYNMNNNKNPDINLYECFEYYGNMELMTGDNQMYCNICNCLYDALYGTLLYTAPNNLIINLNRGKGAVYECNVIFPEKLDLSNYVRFKESNIIFELYAVICHIGPSSMSGHFVAYCKNRMDKRWYLYNDAFVNLCENAYDYQKGMPYILFYQVVK